MLRNKFSMEIPLREQTEQVEQAVLELDRFTDPLNAGIDGVSFMRTSRIYDMLVDFIALDKFQGLSNSSGLERFLEVGRDFYRLNYRMNEVFGYFHSKEGADNDLCYFIAQRMVTAFGGCPALMPDPEMDLEQQTLFLSDQIMKTVIGRRDLPMMDYAVLERVLQAVEALPDQNPQITTEAAAAVARALRELNSSVTREDVVVERTDTRKEFCKFMRDLIPGFLKQTELLAMVGDGMDPSTISKVSVLINDIEKKINSIEEGMTPADPEKVSLPSKETLCRLYLTILPNPPQYRRMFELMRQMCVSTDTAYLFYQDFGTRDYYILQLLENFTNIRKKMLSLDMLTEDENLSNVDVANRYLRWKGHDDLTKKTNSGTFWL